MLGLTGAAVGVFSVHTGLAGSIIALPVLHNLSALKAREVTGTVLAATTMSAGAGAGAAGHRRVVVSSVPPTDSVVSSDTFSAHW